MSFSPVIASKNITEKYYRYLKTSFKMREPYTAEFEKLIDSGETFASGPYLDVTDAFTKGKSISELIDEGILPQSFSRIGMNQTRPLYKHQENAVRKIAQDGRNLVVSTGTGSGKTESFMIPLLRELAMEAEKGTLCPGVRALLIYPMNALANDQTERLRSLLADYPEITFGVYTGQTKQKTDDALAEYKSLNQNNSPIKNELISRDQMIATPPHILITNYAMLEYLMLRPQDSVFFDGEYAKYWKFIVFDEAHVYNGSTGIEVSMLFRRLKAKLGEQQLTYILTSATLGEKENDDEVAEFAEKLCNAPFNKNDIVRADRIIPSTVHEMTKIPLSFYETLADAKDNNKSDVELLELMHESTDSNLEEVLYEIIVHDSNYWNIRRLLESPETVDNLCKKMGWTEKQLTDFVLVASMASKNGGKLFDARYHMFLRATESAFITLDPDNRVMLNRSKFRMSAETGESYKVFEVASCSYCNSLYLIGRIENNKLEQYNKSDEISAKEAFLLAASISDTDEDHTLESEGIKADAYYICPYCGFVKKEGAKAQCEHDANCYVKVFKVDFTTPRRTLTKCLHCENVNNMGVLRMFFSGQEASTSVIGTALFEELPSYTVTVQKPVEEDEFGDEFGVENVEIKEKAAKQFIAFSDSRQAAAFYASYLNISYNSILYKRLIMETLKKNRSVPYSVDVFVDLLHTEFEKNDVTGKMSFDNDESHNITKESWKAVLSELIDNNGNTSLSNFGLLGIDWDISGSFKGYNISEAEFKSLCSVFGLSMMADAAIKYDAPLNENDIEDFTHGGVEYSFTLSDSDARRHQKAFMPTKAGKSNKRIDYLQRVLLKKGIEISNDEAADFLKKLWEKVLVGRSYLSHIGNNAYRVDTSKVKMYLPDKWYVCKKCRKLTCHNIENVCPTYHCEGELIEINPSIEFADNHYYRLYNNMEIRDLRVVEHTAQLDRDLAYDYQKKFKDKRIDVLSCSTTFEMGVDVGSLETVFMRNMPPLPANYAQRAGRAGRSSKAAAFALTFCNKSSHDFTYFNNPTRMIKGKIDPPKYTVENERIAIRHLYAATLSYFWKLHPEYFKTVGKFLLKDENDKSGLERLKEYLLSYPEELKEYLVSFLPAILTDKFRIASFGWIDSLIGEEGVLTDAVKIYEYEVSLLEEAKHQRLANNYSVDGITQRIKAYSSEDILSFMSKNNVLPKYGFPVDTVEMTVSDSKHGKNYGLQLQRDLSMAISEYAPGSQIVANNNLITSRYIKKIPNIGWKMYNYIQCDNCKTLNVKPYADDEGERIEITECCQCHEQFSTASKVFLIPAQGFVADGDKITRPGLKKPERTYRGETSYVGFSNAEIKTYSIGKGIVEVKTTQNDEMAVLNTSPFYVCEQCGYTELDEKQFVSVKQAKHKTCNGFSCGNQNLKRFSLGYRFLTDVVRISFKNYEIDDYEKGLSILHGILRGICVSLNIEENDISGCLQSEFVDGRINYSIVLFDNTPGGSGHAKRLDNPSVLEVVMRYALNLMRGCVCGGDEGDTSCYSCLRNYRNQRIHDMLKRRYVIDFLSGVLE